MQRIPVGVFNKKLREALGMMYSNKAALYFSVTQSQ